VAAWQKLRTVGHGIFSMAAENSFSSGNEIMLTSLDKYVSTTFLSGLVFSQSLCMAVLNADLSQGSAATFVGNRGMFHDDVIANLPTSLPVKEV